MSRLAWWQRIGALLMFAGVAGTATFLRSPMALVADDDVSKTGVLIMRNGMTIEGKILKSGDRYDVTLPNGGKATVFSEFVRLHCENLRDGYEKLRDAANDGGSAGAHVNLARWCLKNQMISEGRQELRDALALDPTRDDAREMLRKLEASLEAGKLPSREPGLGESTPDARKPRPFPNDAESLAGISRDLAQQFTRRIQPMLMNNCAQSGCHGPESENGFRLQRITAGGDTSRAAVERNLAAVLEHVDNEKPRASSLLTEPQGAHGRRGRPVFSGPRGSDQFAELRKWVLAVAREETVRSKSPGGGGPRRDRPEKAGSAKSGLAAAATDAANAPDDAESFRQPGEDASNGDAQDNTARREPAGTPRGVDPFDPEVFNRRTVRGKREP